MGLAVLAPSRRGYDGSPGESLEEALADSELGTREHDLRLIAWLRAAVAATLLACALVFARRYSLVRPPVAS